MRPDYHILRAVYHRDRQIFNRLIKLPFFDLGGSVFIADTQPQKVLTQEETINVWSKRPFPEAVYCVKTNDRIFDLIIVPSDKGDILVESSWIEDGELAVLGIVVKLNEIPGKVRFYATTDSSKPFDTPDEFRAVYQAALAAIYTLQTSPKHVVEITPFAQGKPRTAMNKPWLLDTKKYTLIDLSEAKRYGHRAEVLGTHSSPIPHRRRAHWVELKAERYGQRVGQKLWRRAAWVGDKEWFHAGSKYRVINSEVGQNV